ncbi:general secretion pathway protein GspK [Candidatus Omnitrophota bacterium]
MIGKIRGERATILITALWIVSILAVFAVSIGRQSALSLKLTSYDVDHLKAYFLARAGMMRALAQKNLEYKGDLSIDIDALNESWANNEELFKDHKFGDGEYTIGYEYLLSQSYEEKPPMIYGLLDEQSKININFASKETIANLLEITGVERTESESIAAAILDWRDEDQTTTSAQEGGYIGAENDYYADLIPAYECKNANFDVLDELLFVRGMTAEMLVGIREYITVYGEGRVNINTASDTALGAVFGPAFPNLASKILGYRHGNDDIVGSADDRWFSDGPYTIDREEAGLVEIKNLQEADWYANIYGIMTEEYTRIKEVALGQNPQLGVNSNTYRVIANAKVNKVKVSIDAVYMFEDTNKPPKTLFWYQE